MKLDFNLENKITNKHKAFGEYISRCFFNAKKWRNYYGREIYNNNNRGKRIFTLQST